MAPRTVATRTARLTDAGAIATIYNQGIGERVATFETRERDAEERRAWLREHDERHPVIVAEAEDGEVVGWASISAYSQRECYSGVGEATVYVRRDRRGEGVGRALMASLVQRARSAMYWKLIARIFVANVASRGFFEQFGFREVGVLEKHGKLDGRWIDVVEVERLISENICDRPSKRVRRQRQSSGGRTRGYRS